MKLNGAPHQHVIATVSDSCVFVQQALAELTSQVDISGRSCQSTPDNVSLDFFAAIGRDSHGKALGYRLASFDEPSSDPTTSYSRNLAGLRELLNIYRGAYPVPYVVESHGAGPDEFIRIRSMRAANE